MSILDQVIGGEAEAFLGSGTRNDVLPKGTYKGKVVSQDYNAERGRLYLSIKTGEGVINEGFSIPGAGLNFFLGAAVSAGVKTAGRTVGKVASDVVGKTVYFNYIPPTLTAEGMRVDGSYHKVRFIRKQDWERIAKVAETSAGWDDDAPAKPEPAETEDAPSTDTVANEGEAADGDGDDLMNFI